MIQIFRSNTCWQRHPSIWMYSLWIFVWRKVERARTNSGRNTGHLMIKYDQCWTIVPIFKSKIGMVPGRAEKISILLPHGESYVFVGRNSRYYWQNTQNSLNNLCVCMCVRFTTFQTPIIHKTLEISIWNLVDQWSSYNPLIVTAFMTIDARLLMLWDFEFFEKCSSNFRKIWYVVLKWHTSRNIDRGPLVLNLAKIDWGVQIFWKFEIFVNLL